MSEPAVPETSEQLPVASAARWHRRSLPMIALEVVLIAAGVFLGLAGEQWRENAQHRDLARESLRRLQTEIVTNRKSIEAVRDYHAAVHTSLQGYLTADAKTRTLSSVRVTGLQPVIFEHAAWDLAQATQSLAYIDSDLAFALSRIYLRQEMYADFTGDALHASFLRPPSENPDAFLHAMSGYFADIALWEPELVRMYDEVLPRIRRALGEP